MKDEFEKQLELDGFEFILSKVKIMKENMFYMRIFINRSWLQKDRNNLILSVRVKTADTQYHNYSLVV